MRRKTISICIVILFLSACGKKSSSPPPVNNANSWAISGIAAGHELTISSSARYAGAICSVNWNGKEFINQYDHGRGLQSAVSFDGFGECYNPTEAGSEADGTSDTSTSKLLQFSTKGNQLTSATQIAFWLGVNEAYPLGCGIDTSIKVAQNTSTLSDHILTKQVTIGVQGIDNAIEYLVTFHVPENHLAAVFESLTGYLTSDFSSFWALDPAAQTLTLLSAEPGEQNKPLIFSTADKQYAMGIYSPDLPQASHPKAGYGRFNYPAQGTVKWNAVSRTSNTFAGDYSFRLYVFVGSLSDVSTGMVSMYERLQ